jgi:hypothetical protein
MIGRHSSLVAAICCFHIVKTVLIDLRIMPQFRHVLIWTDSGMGRQHIHILVPLARVQNCNENIRAVPAFLVIDSIPILFCR